MSIEAIIDFELAEMVRFYGSIVGTPGVNQKVMDMCNANLVLAIEKLQPSYAKLIEKVMKKNANLII